MNRHHPYGGYDAGPADRGNRPMPPSNDGGYPSEGPPGGYYPSATPPQHHMQNQPPPQHYQPPPSSMNGQKDYQGGPNRDYREGSGAYPPAPSHDYRAGAPPHMPPPNMSGSRDGRGAGQSSLTLGSGPLNNQSQYGGPISYNGSSGGQSPAPMMSNHNPYGSPPSMQRYTAESAANSSRGMPPMRPQGYESHLPPKPDSAYGAMSVRPSLASPPAHLPRPPGRDWSDDQPAKRVRRDGGRAEEEKSSDEIIKERLRRERPCRTLFVRNVEFNADIDDLRRRFEAFGEIKSWFDLTSKRGLLFISYYDMRCAEHAKAAMQEFEVNGRRVDVHYSLPRESDMTKRCDKDKDQGTLFILLKKAQGELNDDEVRATFSQFGEIKSLRRYKDQGNCRFLEYYDCRACKEAHDKMIGVTWNGGTWDMKFAWDAATPDRIADKPMSQYDQRGPEQRAPAYGAPPQHQQPPMHQPLPAPSGPPRWGNEQSYGAPPPPAPSPGYGNYGPPGGDYRPPAPSPSPSYGTKRSYDYDERANPEPPMRRWGQPQGSGGNPPPGQYGPPRPDQGGPGSYGSTAERPPYGGPSSGADYGRYGAERNDYDYGPPAPASGPPGNRWNGAPAGYGPPGASNPPPPPGPGPAMQRPPPPLQHQGPPLPAGPPAASNDDRLEQAQKVQQLLASLKPGNAAKPPVALPPAPATPSTPTAAAAAAAAPVIPSLPSNIAALLQMAQNNAAKK